MSDPRPTVETVLVVLPAHDEETRIGACLASVAAATAYLDEVSPGVSVAVTVALDRCRDATGRVAARWGAATVDLDAACVGTARRVGVEAATAQLGSVDPGSVLLVNTDADCVVPRTWLVDLVGLAADHDLVLGEVRPDPAEMTPTALAAWWERHPVGRGSLHGANLAVRLDAYQRAGGFPDLTDREDAELVLALRAGGAHVVGGTRVVTSARRTGRVPLGFAGYLRDLDRELVATGQVVAETGSGYRPEVGPARPRARRLEQARAPRVDVDDGVDDGA